MHTIPNLTTIIRDAFPAPAGKIAVDYGPSTQYQHRANLWLHSVSGPITCLPAQQAVKGWVAELGDYGLHIMRLHASIPTQWRGDLVDPLLAEDITALIEYIGQVAFAGGSMRNRPHLDIILSSEAGGDEGATPLGGIPAMTDDERNRAMDIFSTCHRWQIDNRDWLLQYTSRIELLISVANLHYVGAMASVM
ncbi:hypothetical protein WV31_18935 [Magnetospirillum sp. ME-1]|uniref:hypothetical protein n=1 Tax=Magnetospirillum sp. ME-1 TaxID=1639348 RepID=UPI000A17EFB8|nr:hypothetical protein [Magnetospirillum sp. ME-1]ARJ67580.1 hypothetical protein WV31_18935 [Magnetospirillum sp. ME-1]